MWINQPQNKDIFSGEKIINTSGGSSFLTTDNPSTGVTIQAKKSNKGSVYIGDFLELEAGESISLEINNTASIVIKVDASGDGVNYLGVKR